MRKLLVLLLLCIPAFGALPATLVGDIRTAGNGGADTNAGFFDAGGSSCGTNESRGAGTAITITTASTTTGTGSPAFTSTTHGPCNTVIIASGTGCTTGTYDVVSQSGGTATFDRAIADTNGRSCVGVIGGSKLTMAGALSVGVAGNSFNLNSGTYAITATITVATNSTYTNVATVISGYKTTPGDLDNVLCGGPSGSTDCPLVTTSTNSIFNWSIAGSGGNPGTVVIMNNIRSSSTAGTRGNGIQAATGGGCALVVHNCVLDGFAKGIDGDDGTAAWSFALFMDNSEVKNCTGPGVINGSDTSNIPSINEFRNNYIHDNGGWGVQINEAASGVSFSNNTFARNGSGGLSIVSPSTGAVYLYNNNFDTNTGPGFQQTVSGTRAFYVWGQNNTAWGNSTYGFDFTSNSAQIISAQFRNNFYGSNTTANLHNISAGFGDVTLTASPWTSSSVYTLNNTAGGGAAARKAGFPGASPAGTGFMDGGAIQTSGGAGGGQTSSSYVQ